MSRTEAARTRDEESEDKPLRGVDLVAEPFSSGSYEEFANELQSTLQEEWDLGRAQNYLARAQISRSWLQSNPEGTLLMADGKIKVGEAGDLDAVKAAMLLDITSHTVDDYIIENTVVDHRKGNFRDDIMHRLDVMKEVQKRLDDYLDAWGYAPGSSNAPVIYKDLLGIFERGRALAYKGSFALDSEEKTDVSRIVSGMLNEYKVLKALHELGYKGAFLTSAAQDDRGLDIGIPYVDPKTGFSKIKHFQVRSTHPHDSLHHHPTDEAGVYDWKKERNERSQERRIHPESDREIGMTIGEFNTRSNDESSKLFFDPRVDAKGAFVLKVPSGGYDDDPFRLREEDKALLALTMDGYLPLSMAEPQINEFD